MQGHRYYRINDIEDERVALYTEYNEPQLLHINEPDEGIFIAESPMVIGRALAFGARPISFFAETGTLENKEVKSVLEKTGEDVPVYTADLPVINKITGFNLTRGLLCAFERTTPPDVSDILGPAKTIAVLEDIENPANVGAIFRSAAALGADAVLLTPGSSDPFYRRSARVSMGAVFVIPWTYVPTASDICDILHEKDFTVISMALADDAVPLQDLKIDKGAKKAIVFGSEGYGIKEDTLQKSDYISIIPMKQGVDSLNVAAASAVVFWELCF